MANQNSITISVTANVAPLNQSSNGQITTSPTGSITFGETVSVGTSPQLIFNGNNAPFGNISAFNTNPSSSVALYASASGVVNFLGNIAPATSNTIYTPTSIQWNSTLSGLYASALQSSSYVGFLVVTT